MVAALLLTALAQLGPCGPEGPIFCTGSGIAPPLLSFADATGVGMGTACAGTSVTGTKGEALTVVRGTAGTCLKGGLSATGILTGDLVTISSNLPRVMPDPNGKLKVLNEGARTNLLTQTQAFNNPAWSTTSAVIAVPTITADAVNGPCGTPNGTTCFAAERLQTASCGSTVGCNSLVYQGSGLTGAQGAGSVFVKGNGTSGTMTMFFDSTSACIPCPYVSSTWTLCSGMIPVITGGNLAFGTDNVPTSCGDGQALDVFIWGAQAESGAFPSSYITTTTVAVARSGELLTIPAANGATSGSFAASFVAEGSASTVPGATWGNDADHAILNLATAGPAYAYLIDARSATSQFTFYSPGVILGGSYAISLPNVVYRTAGFWSGSGSSVTLVDASGALTSGPGATSTSTTLVELGTYSTTANLYGLIGDVCVDSSSTRCR